MNKGVPVRASCVHGPAIGGSLLLPAPAVVIIVVVLGFTAGLAVRWQDLDAVIATVTIGSLTAVELVRRTVAVFSAHRV